MNQKTIDFLNDCITNPKYSDIHKIENIRNSQPNEYIEVFLDYDNIIDHTLIKKVSDVLLKKKASQNVTDDELACVHIFLKCSLSKSKDDGYENMIWDIADNFRSIYDDERNKHLSSDIGRMIWQMK